MVKTKGPEQQQNLPTPEQLQFSPDQTKQLQVESDQVDLYCKQKTEGARRTTAEMVGRQGLDLMAHNDVETADAEEQAEIKSAQEALEAETNESRIVYEQVAKGDGNMEEGPSEVRAEVASGLDTYHTDPEEGVSAMG